MADNSTENSALWFVAGAAVGATLAILFAPAAGHETRGHIVRKANEGRDVLADSGKDMLDRGKEMLERARALTDQATEMFEKGRKLVDNTAANLQS